MKPELTEDTLVDFITSYGHVSFAEIMKRFEGAAGELQLTLPEAPNVIMWTHVSQHLADILQSPSFRERVEVRPSSVLVYLVDGEIPQLPVAKAKSLSGLKAYKKPHWAPVVFHLRRTRMPIQS